MLLIPGGLAATEAQARRLPTGGTGLVTIGSRVGIFSGQPGPIPNGIRLTLDLAATTGGGAVTFDKVLIPNLGELMTFNPDSVEVPPTQPGTAVLDVGPVLAGQLPPTFTVLLPYSFLNAQGSNSYQVQQQVTLVPLQALGRGALGLSPGSIALGPLATPSGGGLAFAVTVVGPGIGAAFQLQSLSIQNGPTVTTLDPGLLTATGIQAYTGDGESAIPQGVVLGAARRRLRHRWQPAPARRVPGGQGHRRATAGVPAPTAPPLVDPNGGGSARLLTMDDQRRAAAGARSLAFCRASTSSALLILDRPATSSRVASS